MRTSCNAIVCLALATGAQGFAGGAGLRPRTAGFRTAGRADAEAAHVPCSKGNVALSMKVAGESSSRQQFAQDLVGAGALGLAAVFSPATSRPAAAAAASVEELAADLMICKEVFKPALQYLKAEQFDAARTNTNYITRSLNLKKRIDSLIVLADDFIDDPDTLERGFDMAQEVEALFTNFDSSVYTIIFIPGDAAGVLPPGAEKYLKQAYGYYNDINRVLDFYIALVPPESRKAAEKLLPAKRATLPKFLFKEGSALMREKVAIS